MGRSFVPAVQVAVVAVVAAVAVADMDYCQNMYFAGYNHFVVDMGFAHNCFVADIVDMMVP